MYNFFYPLLTISLISFVAIFTLIAGINGAPSIPTPREMTKKMVDLAKIRSGRIYYDLGSGDGRILKEIAKRDGIAIGFEYAPLTFLLSKFLFLFTKNKRIKILWKNFYKINLKNADGIFCYLSPRAMNLLEKKFKKEINNGATIVSYAFKMPKKKPEKVVKIKNYAPIFIYKY